MLRPLASGCLWSVLGLAGIAALLLGVTVVYHLPARWDYSQLGWSVAQDSNRLRMARDYLATHDLSRMTLAELQADLGEPTWIKHEWHYAIGGQGLAAPTAREVTWPTEPSLFVTFDRSELVDHIGTNQDCDPSSQVTFDSAVWKSLSGAARLPMACDLEERQPFYRSTKHEVRGALGDPDVGWMMLEYHVGEDGSDWVYLRICLDAEGRIVDAKIS